MVPKIRFSKKFKQNFLVRKEYKIEQINSIKWDLDTEYDNSYL